MIIFVILFRRVVLFTHFTLQSFKRSCRKVTDASLFGEIKKNNDQSIFDKFMLRNVEKPNPPVRNPIGLQNLEEKSCKHMLAMKKRTVYFGTVNS